MTTERFVHDHSAAKGAWRDGMKNGDEIKAPTPSNSSSLAQSRPRFIPTFRTRAIIVALPPPDGSADAAVRAGGKASWPRRNVRREPGGGGGRRAPLAALSPLAGDRAKPATGLALGLRSPSSDGISVGTAGRACGGLWGLWPRDSCRTRTTPCPAGLVRAGAARQTATACRMRTSSGKSRAARRAAPPRCMASMHHPNPIPKAKPACGPSGPEFPPLETRRVFRAGLRGACRTPSAMVAGPQVPSSSGLSHCCPVKKSWTGCMTLILLVFRRFATVWTRTGGQCHAASQ